MIYLLGYVINMRWPLTSKIQDGRRGQTYMDISLQRNQILGWSYIQIKTFCVLAILVGHTCLPPEEKLHMLILTFTKKNHFCTDLFLQMYSLVPCSKSYESKIFIFIQFWGEMWLKEGHAEKKCFLMSFGLIKFFVFALAIMWPKLQRYAHICSLLDNLFAFVPTVKQTVTGPTDEGGALCGVPSTTTWWLHHGAIT